MRTAFGKLTMLAFILILGILLLAPMRAGIEDTLVIGAKEALMNPGEVLKINYQLHSESAQTVVYSSDNPDVAEVDQLGNVTAMSPGETTIRLKAQGGATANLQVEVTGVAVTSFELNTKLLEMEKGSVSGLSCVFNAGATDRRVEWMSANPSVVRVDGAGRVTAVGAGETYVVATTPSGFSAAATVRVRVKGTAVQITPADMRVGVGASFPMRTYYLPYDATDAVESWKSSNPAVATIGKDGVIHAVSAGSAVISVITESGLVSSTTVTVESAAKDLQINPTSVTIERGDTHVLEATLLGDDQTGATVDHHVEWSTTDPSVAMVYDGQITGLSSGIARITASADGFTAACTVRVQTSVRSVSLNMSEMYLLKEQTNEPFQLKATIEPADADDLDLVYTSDNELVARVSSNGVVTLTGGYGSAVITAQASSGAEAKFAVHVVTELPEPQAEDAAAVETDVDATDN